MNYEDCQNIVPPTVQFFVKKRYLAIKLQYDTINKERESKCIESQEQFS